ncbi:PaaI family thioesterase [Hansschlegelia plantiphila]|uniref:Medium/long-chain acyl-CoA thioesterase YigI n=1 Tax=Hansschlegelia plantiphila TaxID=374655 RepID=A0A9W6J2W6_9HYPH|nr:PaaI family thioesterase [Hansschlegelia plantiphila]GLK68389.1 thioesterase [Hansschlegelia plantiphila]
MTDALPTDRETLDARIRRAPYHQWLGLSIVEVGDGEIVIELPWREEFVVNPEGGYAHGGILATLVDLTADWAIATRLGRPFPTIDLRVDYHRAATKGLLRARGKIIKLGSSFSTAEASVEDEAGRLLASGRGTYATSTK